jgi:Zn-dependent protease with chaperone function
LSFLEFASTYFTSQPAITAIVFLCSLFTLLLVLFKVEKYRPRVRLRILFASFAVVISIWSFVGSSLILCGALISLYETGGDLVAVRTVFGLAILASLVIPLPVSFIATRKVPAVVVKRLVDSLCAPEASVLDMAKRLASGLGMPSIRILQSPSEVPFAYSVGATEGVVVVSEGLVKSLEDDEIETVLAHEFAHIANHDTYLNTIVAAYRKVLFFDPFVRLFEWAIQSEKEFCADEVSARETQRPLSLASALLKISSAGSSIGKLHPGLGGLSIFGSKKILRPPDVRERVERLIRLATKFEGSGHAAMSNIDRKMIDGWGPSQQLE